MVRSASKRPPSTLKQTASVPCARWMPSCSLSVVMAVAGRTPAPHDGCKQMELVNSGSATVLAKYTTSHLIAAWPWLTKHSVHTWHCESVTHICSDSLNSVFTRDTHWRTRTWRDNVAFTFDTLRQRIIKCNVHTWYRLTAIHQQRFTWYSVQTWHTSVAVYLTQRSDMTHVGSSLPDTAFRYDTRQQRFTWPCIQTWHTSVAVYLTQRSDMTHVSSSLSDTAFIHDTRQ